MKSRRRTFLAVRTPDAYARMTCFDTAGATKQRLNLPPLSKVGFTGDENTGFLLPS